MRLALNRALARQFAVALLSSIKYSGLFSPNFNSRDSCKVRAAMDAKLTKKQQKALKHRSRTDKGKGKAQEEPGAFPEPEDLDDTGAAAVAARAQKSKQDKEKKAKKTTLDDGLPYSPIDEPSTSTKPKDKPASKKRKREDGGGADHANTDTTSAPKPKKEKPARSADSKTRYIVFVGR